MLSLGQREVMHEGLGIALRNVKPSAPQSASGNHAGAEEEPPQTIWLLPPLCLIRDERTAKHPRRTQLKCMRRNPRDHKGQKKTPCGGKCRSTPSTVCRGDRQRGETTKHRGVAHADATPVPRKGWATGQRALTQSV